MQQAQNKRMPDPVKTAELIQAYLAAVGINAKIVRQEWGAYLSKTSNGQKDSIRFRWSGRINNHRWAMS